MTRLWRNSFWYSSSRCAKGTAVSQVRIGDRSFPMGGHARARSPCIILYFYEVGDGHFVRGGSGFPLFSPIWGSVRARWHAIRGMGDPKTWIVTGKMTSPLLTRAKVHLFQSSPKLIPWGRAGTFRFFHPFGDRHLENGMLYCAHAAFPRESGII